MKVLVDAAVDQTQQSILPQWDQVGTFIDEIVEMRKLEAIVDRVVEFKTLCGFKFSSVVMLALKIKNVTHALASLGNQQFLLQEGPIIAKHSWLPPLVVSALTPLI